jgi:hypothetical protein
MDLAFVSMRVILTKTLFALAIFLIGHNSLLGQNVDSSKSDSSQAANVLELRENYVIEFRFDSIVYKDKCPCAGFEDESKICHLVKGRVTSIRHIPDQFMSAMTDFELKKIDHLLILEDENSFAIGNSFLISVYSSVQKDYLIFSKARSREESNKYIHYGNILESAGNCYKFNLLVWLGFDPENYPNRKVNEDKFATYIKENTTMY